MRLRLRDMREDRDLTQQKMAAYLGVTQGTYSAYESGRYCLPLAAADKLADYFDTSLDYLTGRTDEPKPYPKSTRPIL